MICLSLKRRQQSINIERLDPVATLRTGCWMLLSHSKVRSALLTNSSQDLKKKEMPTSPHPPCLLLLSTLFFLSSHHISEGREICCSITTDGLLLPQLLKLFSCFKMAPGPFFFFRFVPFEGLSCLMFK